MTSVTVVGIGADGLEGLGSAARTLIREADVVLGADRQLALLPDDLVQHREAWPSPLRENLVAFLEKFAGQRIVAVASGDPLLAGIGTTLIELLGPESVVIVPTVSSVALVRARLRWSAESVEVVRLVGPDVRPVLREVHPGRRLLVLSADGTSPAAVATLLTDAGFGTSTMSVFGNLGAASETRDDALAASWGERAVPPLNVIAIQCESAGAPPHGLTTGLPDGAFDHDGQITKRDVRASALARLTPLPGQLLWDVGAGAGSVGIEWMRAHTTCRAIAIEERDDRAERIAGNAARLSVPDLAVVVGHAPDVLADLERPDAVFVGGGATEPGLLDACWEALLPGGRLVVHGVTLETEALLIARHAKQGGELTRLHVEYAAPIGSFTGWRPSRAIMQWALTKANDLV